MSPFDWRSVVLARHAQHVVLIHFPIALFITGVMFDIAGFARKQSQLGQVAFYNFCAAAVSTVPAMATGLIAWQWALEGQLLKDTLLLLHLICGIAASVLIWAVSLLTWRVLSRGASRRIVLFRFVLEILAVGLLGLAGDR